RGRIPRSMAGRSYSDADGFPSGFRVFLGGFSDADADAASGIACPVSGFACPAMRPETEIARDWTNIFARRTSQTLTHSAPDTLKPAFLA
ncbi:MAG: hypothetical protein WCJ07_08350, partial [Verrucomicrobiota bacterium]